MGELVKLKIIACEDPKYESETGDEFEVMLNPEEFSENYGIEYDESQAPGTTGSDLKFVRIKPETFDLDILFDGTGVLANDRSFGIAIPGLGGEIESVTDQLERFKKVVLEYSGDTHAPRYLKIAWGTLLFKGRLTDLNITYTLFKPDGTPLRAKATASFMESIENEARAAEEDSKSPDLTHLKTIESGNKLPYMSYQIYGSPEYYLEVARVNQLNHFRSLKPGQQLYFPPIDKSTA